MLTTGIYTVGISLLVSIDLFLACLVWGCRNNTLPQQRPWLIAFIFGTVAFFASLGGAVVASMEVNPQAMDGVKFLAAIYFTMYGLCSSEENESRQTGVGPSSIILAFGIAFLSSVDCLLAGSCLAFEGGSAIWLSACIGLAGIAMSYLGLKVSARVRPIVADKSDRYESYSNYLMASFYLWS